jgi:hypothetical protein
MLKRFKWGVRVTALALGLAMTAAMAFFIGSFMADGTHEGTVGSGGTGTKTLSVSLNWEDGKLTPTNPVPLTASVQNTTTKTLTFHHAVATFTSTAPGCEGKWFKVGSSAEFWREAFSGQTKEIVYAPGSHGLGMMVGVENAPTFAVEMTETSVDQSACEGAPLKLEVKLTE